LFAKIPERSIFPHLSLLKNPPDRPASGPTDRACMRTFKNISDSRLLSLHQHDTIKSIIMNKREFLKTSTVIGAATFVAPAALSSCLSGKANGKTLAELSVMTGDDGFVQLPLDYAYDALEPYIDATTMELHYSKHHAGYTKKFNLALSEAGENSKDITDIFSRVSSLPPGVRNNGGGYFNHNLYWKFLSPSGGGEPKGKSAEAIARQFGSFDSFKEQFSSAAATLFGSGWAWLIRDIP